MGAVDSSKRKLNNSKTDTGKPRFARYLRLRDDIEIKENTNSCDKRDRIIEIFSKLANPFTKLIS